MLSSFRNTVKQWTYRQKGRSSGRQTGRFCFSNSQTSEHLWEALITWTIRMVQTFFVITIRYVLLGDVSVWARAINVGLWLTCRQDTGREGQSYFKLAARMQSLQNTGQVGAQITRVSRAVQNQCKWGCKDQESIKSSTTPDKGYQSESDKLTVIHHKREARGQSFPSRWPQGSNKQTRTKPKQKQDRKKHKRSTKEVPPRNGQPTTLYWPILDVLT